MGENSGHSLGPMQISNNTTVSTMGYVRLGHLFVFDDTFDYHPTHTRCSVCPQSQTDKTSLQTNLVNGRFEWNRTFEIVVASGMQSFTRVVCTSRFGGFRCQLLFQSKDNNIPTWTKTDDEGVESTGMSFLGTTRWRKIVWKCNTRCHAPHQGAGHEFCQAIR